MNKASLLLLLVFTLIMTACSGNASNPAVPASDAQAGGAAGELSAPMQVAIGTVKLEGTENAVTAGQAKELLPLWETLQVLETSDTTATEEKDALLIQIEETMTQQQMQAITALNLTRRDMFSLLQSQGGITSGSSANGNSSSANRSNNQGGGFGPGGGGFVSGPPPDGGGFGPAGGENPNLQDQRSNSQSSNSSGNTNQPAAIDPNQIPAPLIQAVIQYLMTKAGS